MPQITFESFEKLEYSKMDINEPTKKANNLKYDGFITSYEFTTTKSMLIDDIFKKIQENIDKLSQIESDENCIPFHVVKRNIQDLISIKLSEPIPANPVEIKFPTLNAAWNIGIKDVLEETILRLIFSHKSFIINATKNREKFLNILLVETLQMTKTKMECAVEAVGPGFRSIFICKGSDLNAAVYNILDDLEDPISQSGLRSMYVQESCYDEFCELLTSKLRPYPEETLKDEYFVKEYEKHFDNVKKLNAKTLKADNIDPKSKNYPIIVLDFGRSHFDTKYEISPIYTLQSFRTIKDGMTLVKGPEKLSIWCPNNSASYEIVKKTNINYFEINCWNVPVFPLYVFIRISNSINSCVLMDDKFHYEYCRVNGNQKSIVYPYGVTYAN